MCKCWSDCFYIIIDGWVFGACVANKLFFCQTSYRITLWTQTHRDKSKKYERIKCAIKILQTIRRVLMPLYTSRFVFVFLRVDSLISGRLFCAEHVLDMTVHLVEQAFAESTKFVLTILATWPNHQQKNLT